MRKRRMKREIIATGGSTFEPSEEQRAYVRACALADLPHETIARLLEVTLVQLQYFFSRELELSQAQLVAVSSRNMAELANQRTDLGVAYRANELILKTRSKAWRVPNDEAQQAKPVETMSLTEVDDAIALLERRRRDASAAADAQAAAPDVEGKPH